MTTARRFTLLGIGILLAFALAEGTARLVMWNEPGPIRWYDASTQLKVDQMDARGDVDVVFAGTSMAWQGFVPAVYTADTGRSAYNAGLAGGTPEVMERWLLEEVVPRLHPETVVWGLSSLDLAPAYGPGQRAIYDDALATRRGILAGMDRWASRYSTVVADRTVLRSAYDMFGGGLDRRRAELADAAATLGLGGERLDFRVDRSQRRADIIAGRLREFGPASSDVELVGSIIDSLHAQGIEVVLVQMPVPSTFKAAHPGGSDTYARLSPALDHIASTHDARFLRLTGGFGDRDFVDLTHLDQSAAIEFTHRFAAAAAGARDDRGRFPGYVPDQAAAAPANPASGCAAETVVDEYGFEIEILRCDDDRILDVPAPTVDDTGPSTPAPLPDRLASRLALAFVDQSGCGGDAPGPAAVPDDAPGAPLLRDALRLLQENEVTCGTDEYLRGYEAAVTLLERAAGVDRPVDDPTSVAETASRALAAIDVIRVEYDGADRRSGYVWYHADELELRLELQRRAEVGDPVEVVAIGSSTTLNDLDQPTLDAAFGGSFLNLGMAAADPEEWRILFGRLFDGLPAPRLVIWPLTTHRLLDPAGTDCDRISDGRADGSERVRARMFPEFTGAASAWDLVLGPDLADSPVRGTPVFEYLSERFRSPGDIVEAVGPFRGIGFLARRYPDPEFCPQRLDIIKEVAADLRAGGSQVVFALLPIHPDVVAAAPEQHAAARAALVSLVDEIGEDLLVIDRPFADAETPDGWHATRAGRDRVTADLIARLRAEGLLDS